MTQELNANKLNLKLPRDVKVPRSGKWEGKNLRPNCRNEVKKCLG